MEKSQALGLCIPRVTGRLCWRLQGRGRVPARGARAGERRRRLRLEAGKQRRREPRQSAPWSPQSASPARGRTGLTADRALVYPGTFPYRYAVPAVKPLTLKPNVVATVGAVPVSVGGYKADAGDNGELKVQ